MKHIALIAVLLLSACVTPQEPTGTPRAPNTSEYPADVQKFIDDREGCEHFIGEEAYDEERRVFLEKNINELCTGTDEKLEALRAKYKDNKKVILRLSAFEHL